MVYRYSRIVESSASCAVGLALPISLKVSVEICREIKGKSLPNARRYLDAVTQLKQAVPMIRRFQEVAHKPGMAVGKYPTKCAAHILSILTSAEANARAKGFVPESLFICHAAAQKAHTTHHYGRLGRKAKRTHIEIVLKEKAKAEKKLETKPVAQKVSA